MNQNADTMLTMGKEAEGRGLILKALAFYKQGLTLEPRSKELAASVDRLNAQLAKAEKDGTLHVDRKAEPTADVEVMFKQAEVFVKYGITTKAVEQLEKLLAVDPQHAQAKALLVSLRADAGS